MESVRGRPVATAQAKTATFNGSSEKQSSEFAPTLKQQLLSMDRGGASGTGESNPATLAPVPATRDGDIEGVRPIPLRDRLSEALHCLTVRARPQAPVQFSLAALLSPVAVENTLQINQAHPVESSSSSTAFALSDYPRPAADNGRGMHWIPTTSQSKEVVDRFVPRLEALGARWLTFLNEPADLTSNTYLVNQLNDAGIMPVMRVYTASGADIEEDIGPLVSQYKQLGVSYFQLYNEPNLKCENEGQMPDPARYVAQWIPAARQVVEAGGLPGIGALSPQGDVNDVEFLRHVLEGVKAQGAGDLLDKAWLSVHNYGQDYLRVREYDEVVRHALGRSLPQIGTEAGIYPGGGITEEDQVRIVTDAYRYMAQPEPYYFAYSLWALANQAGGGRDERWEGQVLYRQDGPTPLARALEAALGNA